ncbi:transglycosylase SLT domain-containing protein [Blochmannia endosymbiont of Colobopsis nipponica]|nr:transglycosylase SLT domain-containing protein [Blochmannia endosymbiont of Colobopsis nipponica]QOI11061.1 transglycosylase SLT domain-containing protein [Blochmannia endosymbiont of Colobopsis nipponica]
MLYCLCLFLLCFCTIHSNNKKYFSFLPDVSSRFLNPLNSNINLYDEYISSSANVYKIDKFLIKAIIKVESGFNPTVVSKSNAVGLMQIKSSTAGRDAYKMKGWQGEPSIQDLKNASINIDLGTAYLSILQKQLVGISDPKIKRYAIIVSYVNGLSALLHIFSSDFDCAISKINKFTSEEFYQYIQDYHPSFQARRYLWKVNIAYLSICSK